MIDLNAKKAIKQRSKGLSQRIWFRILLVFMMFAVPIYSQLPYNPVNTPEIISSVLSQPLVASVDIGLPLAKSLLFAVVLTVFLLKKASGRLFASYNAFILIIVGLFQNMAVTVDYGFVWLLGNTSIMLLLAVFWIMEAVRPKSEYALGNLNKNRFWVLPLMALAFWMPYGINSNGLIEMNFSLSSFFLNEAGVTYCMVSPVVTGVMILFSRGVNKPLLSLTAFVGLLFGIINMLTWFILQPQNWWMGVLHLPLLFLSVYGLIVCKQEKEDTHIK